MSTSRLPARMASAPAASARIGSEMRRAMRSAASAPRKARNAARYTPVREHLGELLARRRQRQADARQAHHLASRLRAARLRRHGDGGGARRGHDRRPQIVVALGGQAHRPRVGIGEQRAEARRAAAAAGAPAPGAGSEQDLAGRADRRRRRAPRRLRGRCGAPADRRARRRRRRRRARPAWPAT